MKLKYWLLGLAVTAGGLWFVVSDPRMSWREEVQLKSGEVIVIKRTAKFSENWIAGGGGGSFNRGMTIEFDSPNKPDNPTIWSGLYVPILLDRDPDTNEWTVVATFFHCDSWYDIGRPKLPYTQYQYRGGQWVQQAIDAKWIGREGNAISPDLFDRKAINASRPIFTLSDKEKRLRDRPGIDRTFKGIVDRSTNCP